MITVRRMKLSLRVALALAFFMGLTVVKTYPLIRHFEDHLPSDLGDPLLNIWILAWDFHALTTDPWNLFNANIFYPASNTLALSEHLIGALPIFAPVYALTGNSVLAYNMVFSLSFVFSALAMFFLIHYWTHSFWASLLSGSLYAFSPLRLGALSHLQILNLYWAPLALLFLEKFLHSKRWGDFTLFAICYWWQVLCSVYLGWFITMMVVIYFCYSAFFIDKGLLNRSMFTKYATFGVLSALILLPFHLPYYELKQQWGFSRSIDECITYSADLILTYMNVNPLMNDLYVSIFRFASVLSSPTRNWLFPGLVAILLMLLGVVRVRGVSCSFGLGRAKRIYEIILASSFILSLGPYLVVLEWNTSIPLPYLLLYQIAPGFQAMRVPTRFAFIVVLAASVLSAIGFLRACHFLKACLGYRRPRPLNGQSILALVFIGLFILELGFKPLPLARIQTGHEVPEVYRWLAEEKPAPIVELPMGMWENFRYQYFSTYHWLPIVNGWSGFVPSIYFQIVQKLRALPSRQAVELLSAMGVERLILHTAQLEAPEASRWRLADLTASGLEERARFGADVVYQLAPVEVAPRLHLRLAVLDDPPTGEMISWPAGVLRRLGLFAETKSPHLWIHPAPLGQTQALIKWEEVQTRKTLTQRQTLELPFAMMTGEVWSTGLPVNTPPSPGRYRLSFLLPSWGLEAPPKLVHVISSPDRNSTNACQSLSVAYVLDEPSSPSITSRVIEVTLQAINTGSSVWLAETNDDRGEVRLGWRWYRGDDRMPFQEGREQLPYDIFPGQAHRFQTTINAPPELGRYTLELGLVCELVTWFSDQGVTPFRFDVYVESSEKALSP